ncbi:MAG TPA: DUF4350 domain-containing protein, partial [Pseudolysinimonas sp.]|nr:DUF4350 domain-containing protein [Pseudolysinimonas sp.]
MTTTAAPEIATPTVRAVARRIRVIVLLGLAVVLVGVFALVLGTRPGADTARLAADNPGPDGAQALVRVLQQHGVSVKVTDTLDETEGASGDPAATTVLLYDPGDILTAEQHERLREATDHLVLVEPDLIGLRELAPRISVSGSLEASDGPLTAGCTLPSARKAGTISGSGLGYAGSGDGVTSCFSGPDGAALVQQRDDDRTVSALGLGDILSNGAITDAGNAALAVNLLGAQRTLVWYTPGFGDLPSAPATLAQLTPPWVAPLVLLFGLVGLAAVFWRGRRLGRVIIEELPVVVRASETMEGMARLYERSNARRHALDALRMGAAERLAARCKLPRTASLDAIVDAVAAATGRDRGEVAAILRDA